MRKLREPKSKLRPGDKVWFAPTLKSPRFAAVVTSEPWLLGGHTEVVQLGELPDEYRAFKGHDCKVPIAPVSHVFLRRDDDARPMVAAGVA